MATVQELVKRWWTVALIVLCALLWIREHDKRLLQTVHTQEALDSLTVTTNAVNALSASNQSLDTRNQRLVAENRSVRAAAARAQVVSQKTTDSLLAQISETVPVEAQPVVAALQQSFERERINFRAQIEAFAKLDTVPLGTADAKNVTIDSLVRMNTRVTSDYADHLRADRPNFFKTLRQAVPYVAAGIILGKVL